MDYLVKPIAWIVKFSFDYILVPIGNLPTIINPNTLFVVIGIAGMLYWLYWQGKYNKIAKERGTLK